MKKLLIAILLGMFFICASSANAAQDEEMTPGMIADQAAAAYADVLLKEKLVGEYEKAGKIEDAKKVWGALLTKVTIDPGLYGRYAEFLNRTGDANGAIAQLKKAQQLDPANTFYTFRMAEILAMNNRQNEAKAILTKLISEAKDSWVKEDAERRLEQVDTLTLKNMLTAPAEGGAVSTPITPSVQQTAVPVSLPVPPKQDTTKEKGM